MTRRILTVVALLGCAAGVAAASAQRSHFGMHGGYNFDLEEGAIGVQMQMPLGSAIDFYPSFDYYLVGNGTLLGFNGDLRFRAAGVPLYFGGGLNVLTGGGDSDAGLNLIAGFESRSGQTHPYVEARGLIHDNASFQLLFGVNFTLY